MKISTSKPAHFIFMVIVSFFSFASYGGECKRRIYGFKCYVDEYGSGYYYVINNSIGDAYDWLLDTYHDLKDFSLIVGTKICFKKDVNFKKNYLDFLSVDSVELSSLPKLPFDEELDYGSASLIFKSHRDQNYSFQIKQGACFEPTSAKTSDSCYFDGCAKKVSFRLPVANDEHVREILLELAHRY